MRRILFLIPLLAVGCAAQRPSLYDLALYDPNTKFIVDPNAHDEIMVWQRTAYIAGDSMPPYAIITRKPVERIVTSWGVTDGGRRRFPLTYELVEKRESQSEDSQHSPDRP